MQYFCEYEEVEIPTVEIDSLDDFIAKDTERKNVYSLIDSPLYDFKLFKLKGTNTGGLLANFHHIICDGFSAALFIRQVFESYKSLITSGTLPDINPENNSYKQYLNSEKDYIESPKFAKDKAYWNEIYKTIPEVATLYSSKQRENTLSCEAARSTFLVDRELMNKIKELCAKNKFSVYNFFMAIFGLYISKSSRLDDFVIGTPILNRTNYREKNTFGMFISTVPFRVNITSSMPFNIFAEQIAKDTISTFRHQKYSYQYIIEDLRQKSPSIPNLYNIMLSYQISKASDSTSRILCRLAFKSLHKW